jgi:hypothetical protein
VPFRQKNRRTFSAFPVETCEKKGYDRKKSGGGSAP